MSYENLAKLSRYFRVIQEKDDSDVFIGTTGRKGAGKTTFSIQSSRNYVETYFGEKYFNLRRYVAFNNDDVFDKMHKLPIFAPIAGDEAIRFAWSREWNKSDNKDLAKLSTQIRPKKHILFMNIPKLVWIDKAYREGMLTMWAWIHAEIDDTGQKNSYAVIFEPDENQGENDSWHLKQLRQTEGKVRRIGRFTPMDQMYNLVKNHPCFFDIIKFPRLPADLYAEYMDIRTSNVMKDKNDYVDQRDLAKVICYNLMKNWPGFLKQVAEGRFERPTYRIIADTLAMNPVVKKQMVQHTTLRNWVNEIAELLPEEAQIMIEDEDANDTDSGTDEGIA